jgi:hypothetical protein
MNTQWIRAGALSSLIAAGLLGVQIAIGAGLGSDLMLLETSPEMARVAAYLQTHAATLTQLMAVDDLFVVAYSVGFVGIALYLTPRNRLFALVGLGFALLTSASDFTENSLTIVLTRAATGGVSLQMEWLMALQVLTQLKYLWIFAGGTLFAIGIWDKPIMHRALAVLFCLFPVIGALAMVSVTGALLRILWMLGLLLAGAYFLWRAAEKNPKSL